MHVTITNFRGLQRADFTTVPLALIAGPNAAGKTSAVQAIAAALTGQAIPLPGLRRQDAGALVRTGGAEATIALSGDGGTTTVRWPACKIHSDGEPPAASVYAAGLETITALSRQDRARALAPYLRAEPTRDDLAAALPDLTADHLDRLWQSIEINGWDTAHQQARDKGVERKGRWQQVTGEKYGARKAANWYPDDWGEDLEGASEQSLQDALAREREYLEAAIASQAVSDERRRELQDRADALDGRRAAAETARAERDAAASELEQARARRAELPSADAEATTPCPHCGEPVIVRAHHREGATLQKPDDDQLTPEQIKARRLAIAEADDEIERLRGRLQQAERAVQAAERAAEESEQARAALDELPPPAEGEAPDVEAARERVRRAETRVRAFQTKRDADRIHESIETNQRVIDTLAPDGLRARKLREASAAFARERLAPLCEAARWGAVALDDDLMPTYRGRPYVLLSESEQYRCRVTLQVAMAQADGSHAVVIDGADVLDRGGRNGLVRMLAGLGMPAIVAMTESAPDRVPDLAAKGLGVTIWIDGGVARPVGEVKEAA